MYDNDLGVGTGGEGPILAGQGRAAYQVQLTSVSLQVSKREGERGLKLV